MPSSACNSKLNKIFFGYSDPQNMFFLDNKMDIFWGDLTDISARKEALVSSVCSDGIISTLGTLVWS